MSNVRSESIESSSSSDDYILIRKGVFAATTYRPRSPIHKSPSPTPLPSPPRRLTPDRQNRTEEWIRQTDISGAEEAETLDDEEFHTPTHGNPPPFNPRNRTKPIPVPKRSTVAITGKPGELSTSRRFASAGNTIFGPKTRSKGAASEEPWVMPTKSKPKKI